jgi:hypothetical protein
MILADKRQCPPRKAYELLYTDLSLPRMLGCEQVTCVRFVDLVTRHIQSHVPGTNLSSLPMVRTQISARKAVGEHARAGRIGSVALGVKDTNITPPNLPTNPPPSENAVVEGTVPEDEVGNDDEHDHVSLHPQQKSVGF